MKKYQWKKFLFIFLQSSWLCVHFRKFNKINGKVLEKVLSFSLLLVAIIELWKLIDMSTHEKWCEKCRLWNLFGCCALLAYSVEIDEINQQLCWMSWLPFQRSKAKSQISLHLNPNQNHTRRGLFEFEFIKFVIEYNIMNCEREIGMRFVAILGAGWGHKEPTKVLAWSSDEIKFNTYTNCVRNLRKSENPSEFHSCTHEITVNFHHMLSLCSSSSLVEVENNKNAIIMKFSVIAILWTWQHEGGASSLKKVIETRKQEKKLSLNDLPKPPNEKCEYKRFSYTFNLFIIAL